MKKIIFVVFLLSFLLFVFPSLSQDLNAEISTLSFSPSEPIIFENVSIHIKVKNTGKSYGDFKLELFVSKGGEIKYEKDFSFGFEPGMVLSFSPTYLPDDIGEYEIVAKLYDKNELVLYDTKIAKFRVVSEVGPFDLSTEVLTRRIRPGEELPVILRILNRGEKGVDVKVKVDSFCFDQPFSVNEFSVYLEPKSSLDKLVSMPTCLKKGLHLISSKIILYNKTWTSSQNQFFIEEPCSQLILKVPELLEIKQGKSKVFDVFVKNPSNSSVHDLKLVIEKVPMEWVDVSPHAITEVGPNDTVLFVVNLTIPKDTQPIEYPVKVIVGSSGVMVKKESTLKILAAPYYHPPSEKGKKISLLEQLYQLMVSNKVLILLVFSLLTVILVITKIRKRRKAEWRRRREILRKVREAIGKK